MAVRGVNMDTNEIHINDITIPVNAWTKKKVGRLYYYQGNFFFPLSLPTDVMGKVLKSIRIFTKENKEMIARDRKSPDYIPYDKLENL